MRDPVQFLSRCTLLLLFVSLCGCAQELCPRLASGSEVPEPADLRSKDGVLKVELTFRGSTEPNGNSRYCFVSSDGSLAPNLRVTPGDEVIISLKNGLPDTPPMEGHSHHHAAQACTSVEMSVASANLHFHGLEIPPVCHQDETLRTTVRPTASFEYHFKIPRGQPPGLYWYHPHVHGFTKSHVLGGASGALIVDGIESADPEVAGLPERVLVVRDQELVNPDASPVASDSMPAPLVLKDAEGDILNTGTGGGKPAKDLSINFVPVPFPDYVPAVISMRPGERQLWRVLNASAITYLDLQLLFQDQPQQMGVVALDGIPVNQQAQQKVVWKGHILLPPAGRAEFIVKAPQPGIKASFVTRTVDTGPAGENDPTRPLATIITRADSAEPNSTLGKSRFVFNPRPSSLAAPAPAHERHLYFSEIPQNPNDPNSPTQFFLTVAGKTPKAFDPNSTVPDITVHSGDIEDWIVENRSTELHAFHIHQTHFQLMEWNGVPVDEPFLRDTINVPYWDGKSPVYPSVRLRIDFRNPDIVGTFPYHCHLLEHEDNGMMGTVRVLPAFHAQKSSAAALHGRIDGEANQHHSR